MLKKNCISPPPPLRVYHSCFVETKLQRRTEVGWRGMKSEFIEARKTIDVSVCGAKLVLWEESCKSVTKL